MLWKSACTCGIALGIILAGCGSNSEQDATSSRPQSTAHARVPAGLVGTYTRKITRTQIKAVDGASLKGPPEGLPTGEETMRIIGDASVGFTFSDGGVETGTLKFVGHDGRFEITTSGFCPRPSAGVYEETLEADALTIGRLHDDHCPDRAVALAARWRKVS
jgi:hypothetical protein